MQLVQISLPVPLPGRIEGRLAWPKVVRVLVPQLLLTVLLAVVALLGTACWGIYANPKDLIANPSVFLWLGLTLLTLALVGWYVGVARYWRGSVRRFSWDGERLVFRTLFSRRWHDYRAEEIVALSARRTNARREFGSLRYVRFRDGRSVKLPVGPLENAERLYVELKSAMERLVQQRLAGDESLNGAPIGIRTGIAAGIAEDAAVPTSDHPCWLTIQPHLEAGEVVLWLGRPMWRKLRSEMSAEMVFGLIPGALAIGLTIVGWHVTVRQGILSGLVPASIGILFGCLSAYLAAAPWRFRSMVRDTIYVVTDRRVLLVQGFVWGQRAAVQRDGEVRRVIPRGQVHLFELADNQRDILLGGEWRRGHKGARHWVHFGMLAVDDPHGAARAIHRLCAQEPDAASIPTAFDC